MEEQMAPEMTQAQMTPPEAAPAFLHSAGWGDARILPLAGDASFRRYFRVIDNDRQAVLMDAPPPHEDPRPFLAVADHLIENGFAAPSVYARDLDHGLILLEDFGDIRVREYLEAAPHEERSEEHTSELQSLMRTAYAVFCLKKKINIQ